MARVRIVRLGVIVCLLNAFSCGFTESSCTAGFQSDPVVFKVHRDHLHRGKRLGTVTSNTCDGRTRALFQSDDQRFDVSTDGTVALKRPVTLHEGHKGFSVSAWDSSGEKHTASVRVERVQHHMDTVMNISSPQMESQSDLVLKFPKSSTSLKRVKRGWVTLLHVSEESSGPFPRDLVMIMSDLNKEAQVAYRISGEGVDLDPKGIFTVERLTGRLRLHRPLDREKKASYKLMAHASVIGSTVKEAPREVIIEVLDQNDNFPIFTQNPFNGNVSEASEIGHEFMTVTATDADDPDTNDNGVVRYSISKQDPELPHANMFEISPNTGSIRVNSLGLDKEKWSKYTLLVVAADMDGAGRPVTGTAVITVTDSNDNAPQFEQTTLTVSVPENEVGAVVATLTVTDEDEPESSAWSTKYRIIAGDKGGFFNVSTGPSRLEGIITTVKPLDFEKNEKYVLSVIVENDDPFVGSLATSTATVTVNVLDVNEPPEFNPKEKEIHKLEDSPLGDLVSYTATDPDVAKSQKITYRILTDPDGWLSVNPDTGMIRVKKPMDRESPSVIDGKYRAVILAVDNDAEAPATGTGTLVIVLEDVNDNAPVINEREITLCNRGAQVLLSITEKYAPPFAGPFSVQTQGETSKNWFVSMNEAFTGIILKPKFALEEGVYNVVLRVFDQHTLSQDSTVKATVCDCEGESDVCTGVRAAGMELPGVLAILGAISLLLLLALLLHRFMRKKEPSLPEDDTRDYYDEEGGGEEDQIDFMWLRHIMDNQPQVFRNDVTPTIMPAPQYRPRPANPDEISTFIDDNLKATDNDPTATPYDSLRVFKYEGEGSDAGSFCYPSSPSSPSYPSSPSSPSYPSSPSSPSYPSSPRYPSSLNSSSSGGDQDYDFINDWGPRFKKLVDMYGGGDD